MPQKDKLLLKNDFNKQRGFTLLELVVVIIIISILGLFAIDRVLAIRIAAEQSAIKQLVGTIKSALGLKVSQLALEGNMLAVAQLDKSNPLDLLSQTPSNYIGEKDNSKSIAEPGVWYFNNEHKTLIYNVRYNEGFKTKLSGLPRIRYKIKLVYNDRNNNKRFDTHYDSIAGLNLIPLEKFSWNVKINNI